VLYSHAGGGGGGTVSFIGVLVCCWVIDDEAAAAAKRGNKEGDEDVFSASFSSLSILHTAAYCYYRLAYWNFEASFNDD